jgi:hypothetical protein
METKQKPQEVKKPNETFQLIKDFSKVMILEGRDKLADGIYKVAETVDITQEQEKFCESFHKKIEDKRREKESKNLNLSGAKA